MRAIIHVGMTKTGTSAIQNFFAANEFPGFEYARYRRPNHSGLMILLFEAPDRVQQHHSFRPRGEEFLRTIPALRSQLQDELDAQIARLSESDTTLIISAEALIKDESSGIRGRLADYILRRASEVKVIGYLRPPRSWSRSAFQQKLQGPKTHPPSIEPPWPNYRKGVEELDGLFGRENVELRIYRRDLLHRGDIVSDFGQVLGLDIPVPPEGRQLDNESLSAEATALLYLHRKLGTGYPSGFNGALAAKAAFVKRLRPIGRRRFTFSDSLWQPVLESHADDLAWIQERAGRELGAQPDEVDAIPIGSEQDLIDLALAQVEELERLVGHRMPAAGEDRLSRAILALEELRDAAAAPLISEAAQRASRRPAEERRAKLRGH